MPRAIHRRLVVHGERRLPVRSPVEQAIDVVGRFQLSAVDGKNVIADVYIRSRRRKGRAQIGIPILVIVDARDSVTAVFDGEVRAQQTTRRLRHFRHIAAAHVRMTDRNL